MISSSITFQIYPSWSAWKKAISTKRPQKEITSLAIPLPPNTTHLTISHLKTATKKLMKSSKVDYCPVDCVIALGRLGEIAAHLFAWLTNSPLYYCDSDHLILNRIKKICAKKSAVLICCDSNFSEYSPTDISLILKDSSIKLGFVYPFDLNSALISAFKAAFEIKSDVKPINIFINTESNLDVNCKFGNLHLASGKEISATAIENLLTEMSHTKTIVTHGNGFDYSLGKAVICCIKGEIPVLDNPAMFTCFQTGECVRTNQKRIDLKKIKADLFVMATCWGLIENNSSLDYEWTAYAHLITSINVWALITTAIPWTLKQTDWLYIYSAIVESQTQGDAAKKLNHILDPLNGTFLLFGNPNSRIDNSEIINLDLDPKASSNHYELSSGFNRLRSKSASNIANVYVMQWVKQSRNKLLSFCSVVQNDIAITFSNVNISVAPKFIKEIEPLPDIESYSRIAQNFLFFEHFLPKLGDSEDLIFLSMRIASFRNQYFVLAREFERRKINNNYLLFEKEIQVIKEFQEEMASITQSIISIWLEWSSNTGAGKFIMDKWRSDYQKISTFEGKPCDVCKKATRSYQYSCLAMPLPDRTITFCRFCSTKSDYPTDFEMNIYIRNITFNHSHFTLSIEFINNFSRYSLLNSAAFFMSANRAWANSIAQADSILLQPNNPVKIDFSIDKPNETIQGEHWFIIIGLFDGKPFMYSNKVIVANNLNTFVPN